MKAPSSEPEPLAERKRAARQAAQAWRRTLTAGDISRCSQAINAALLEWPPLRGRRHVMGFAPLRREPQCQALLDALRARGVFVALPVVDGPDVRPWRSDLGRAAPAASLDAVLVPGLAFDRSGGRLGRGGGHYDRLLVALDPECLCVGVCFEGQVVSEVPREPWDRGVDALTTESGVVWAAGRRGGRERSG